MDVEGGGYSTCSEIEARQTLWRVGSVSSIANWLALGRVGARGKGSARDISFLHSVSIGSNNPPMPRALRVEYAGAHYHAMCRGNNGREIFLDDDGRRLFLSTLDEVCQQTGWLIHAHVLMSNHYHLLLETPEANLVAGMKWFQGTYTQRFNAMFKRRGHLFQGRYKAIPIATDPHDGGLEHFREVSTYIHLNPFRAKLCGEGLASPLQAYAWSSYPAYCGLARKRPAWLVREKVLRPWGQEGGAAA